MLPVILLRKKHPDFSKWKTRKVAVFEKDACKNTQKTQTKKTGVSFASRSFCNLLLFWGQTWILRKTSWKSSKRILPNLGLILIYHGTPLIHHLKQIQAKQGFGSQMVVKIQPRSSPVVLEHTLIRRFEKTFKRTWRTNPYSKWSVKEVTSHL